MKFKHRIYALLWAVSLSIPAYAVEGKIDTHTVYYTSSGPGQPNGYENASVDVRYALMSCAGTLTIAVQRVKGSVKGSERYWFEGGQFPALAPVTFDPLVPFRGSVFHGGNQIGRFSVEAGNALGMGCTQGDTQSVAKLSDHLGPKATDSDIRNFINALHIAVDKVPKPLQNGDLESAIRAERLKVKKEAEATERERQAKARREEQERNTAEARERSSREVAEDGQRGGNYARGGTGGVVSGSANAHAGGTGWGSYAKSNDGRYWKKDGNGGYQEVSGAEYQAARDRETESRRKAADKETSRKNDATVRRAQEAQHQALENMRRNNERIKRESDRRMEIIDRSYYAAEAARNARENVDSLTKMEGSYESAAELEADYDRRMRQLNREMESLEEADRQTVEADKDMYFGGGSEADRAFGNVVGIFANMVRDSDREDEKQRARARLEERRAEMLKKIAANRLESRKRFLATFPDGNVPLSSHKAPTDTLYFFSYTFDKNAIERDKPEIVLANTFPVARYGDGTWPFKHSINGDLRKLTPGENTLMGYYATKELADEMRSSFINLAKKNGFLIKDVEYAGRARAGTNGNPRGNSAAKSNGDEFWGAPSPGKKTSQGQADFWGEADTRKKTSAQGQDDFWK